MANLRSTPKKSRLRPNRVKARHNEDQLATGKKRHLRMPTVVRRLRVHLDEGNKIGAVKQTREDTGYSLSEALRLVHHCKGERRLSDKELASSWCNACRNSLSACQCASLPRPYELSAIARAEKAPAPVSHGAVYGATDRAKTQLEVWRRIRDLAGSNPDEVSRIANSEIQKLEAEVLDLWEVLVPLASNDGVPFSEDHHEAFRRVVRGLPGNRGTTTRPAGDGDWQDCDTGKVYAEKMIPIRFRACKADAERIAEHARKFYGQIAVMAYKIASGHDIIMAKRKN
ncbi:MAG TPA: hypothetical protein VK788_06720 [Terriglobales bacterium]|nr:hypothetical protein [Terriglobales bacterium]